MKNEKGTPFGVPISDQDNGTTPKERCHEIRVRPLNELCEKWKDFDSNYVVGDDGHIYRRLKANYYRSRKYGYLQVRNYFGTRKQHTVKVHDAVGRGFVDNPDNLSDVDHINNDKTDNRAENLQYLSHVDNIRKKQKDKQMGGTK